MSKIPVPLRLQVEDRANNCCEYCLLPNTLSFYTHEVDHVIAQKHKGTTSADNLTYAAL
ncbi:HNH endonuclease signature motif containing protein [Acaryochloris sp. IP29b_bin.148]|uniref:HNH endonuclease n=1 Tax=Acaryochloris sp. IP29b_bin.148 TaxID=2969218 RepID=UPI0034523F6E